VTEEVLASIKSDKQLAAGDKQKALKLAEEKVLPYIDFEEATRLAVGRSWSQATPEQRKKLVVRVPQHAGPDLLERDRVVPGANAEGDAFARRRQGRRKRRGDGARAVRPRRRQAAADRFPDAQRRQELEGLRHRGEGISLVLTYRSEFDAVVKQEGIDGLIKRLTQKNSPAKLG
jgi:phospholipid transport system substrate-binding protein